MIDLGVFLDSGIFIGAFYKRDQQHESAKKLLYIAYNGEFGRCYTSSFILDEFVSYLTGRARNSSRKMQNQDYKNIQLGEYSIQQSEIRLLHVSEETISTAKVYFGRFWDIGLDLTDWTTAVLMREKKIENILSFDSGFDRLKSIAEFTKIRRIG